MNVLLKQDVDRFIVKAMFAMITVVRHAHHGSTSRSFATLTVFTAL